MTPPVNPPTPEQRERARALLKSLKFVRPDSDTALAIAAAFAAAEFARGHAAGQEEARAEVEKLRHALGDESVAKLSADHERLQEENGRLKGEVGAVLTAARRALQVHRALVRLPDAKLYCAVCRCPKDDGPHYDECPLYPLWTWVEAHDAPHPQEPKK